MIETTVYREVFRTKPIGLVRGFALPAFIRNMQYHFSPLTVYADGLIDCWDCVDLDLFHRKVKQGWVATEPPNDSILSIFNLGWAKVANADWMLTPSELLKEVERAVETLNPGRSGLVNMGGEQHEVRNGVKHSKYPRPNGKPYFLDLSGAPIFGDSTPVFLHKGSEFHLSQWTVYPDGTSQVGSNFLRFPLDQVAQRLQGGDLATSAPNGSFVVVEGLGRFQVQAGGWGVKPKERIREATDKIAKLRGENGSVHNCLQALHAYHADPREVTRERLREAYEAVPQHLRMYCGTMDEKDGPIRSVLLPNEVQPVEQE
jgi:hypothetical protein